MVDSPAVLVNQRLMHEMATVASFVEFMCSRTIEHKHQGRFGMWNVRIHLPWRRKLDACTPAAK